MIVYGCRVSTTVIPLTRGQRRTLLRCAAFLGAVAVAAAAWTAITAATAGLAAGVLVNVALGRVVVGEAGVRTWRPLRRRTVGWDEIAAIEVATARERSGKVFRLVIVTTKGRRVRLPAPMSAWWGWNNDFGRQHRTLCALPADAATARE